MAQLRSPHPTTFFYPTHLQCVVQPSRHEDQVLAVANWHRCCRHQHCLSVANAVARHCSVEDQSLRPTSSLPRAGARASERDQKRKWRQAVPNTLSALRLRPSFQVQPPPPKSVLMSATVAHTTLPRAAPGAPPEEQAAAFEDDPRVYFDTQNRRWRLEDGDAELEYEPSKAVWIPVVSQSPSHLQSPQGLRWARPCMHTATGRRGPCPQTAGRLFDSRR